MRKHNLLKFRGLNLEDQEVDANEKYTLTKSVLQAEFGKQQVITTIFTSASIINDTKWSVTVLSSKFTNPILLRN